MKLPTTEAAIERCAHLASPETRYKYMCATARKLELELLHPMDTRAFSYAAIEREGRQREFRICDQDDNRVASCYSEANAAMIVRLLNLAVAVKEAQAAHPL